MRMWMLDPRRMCKQHLIGEHVEIHMLVSVIKKKISLQGFLEKKLIEPASLEKRHFEIAKEMERRGYKHKSKLLGVRNLKLTTEQKNCKVDISKSARELLHRCDDCRLQFSELIANVS